MTKTLILIDATASMNPLLGKTKETIGIMFDRISNVLKKNSIAEDKFMMKLAYYRNYNCYLKEPIFGQSGWETNPTNLLLFLN